MYFDCEYGVDDRNNGHFVTAKFFVVVFQREFRILIQVGRLVSFELVDRCLFHDFQVVLFGVFCSVFSYLLSFNWLSVTNFVGIPSFFTHSFRSDLFLSRSRGPFFSFESCSSVNLVTVSTRRVRAFTSNFIGDHVFHGCFVRGEVSSFPASGSG